MLTEPKMADGLFSCNVIQGQALLHLRVGERLSVDGMSRQILARLFRKHDLVPSEYHVNFC